MLLTWHEEASYGFHYEIILLRNTTTVRFNDNDEIFYNDTWFARYRPSLFPNNSLDFELVQIETEAETWGALNCVGGQWTIRGALRRSLWFTVISAFAHSGGTADRSGLRSYNSAIEKKRRRKEGASRWAEISRGSVYRAVFAITFDPARCLSLFLAFAVSPQPLQPFLSVVRPS